MPTSHKVFAIFYYICIIAAIVFAIVKVKKIENVTIAILILLFYILIAVITSVRAIVAFDMPKVAGLFWPITLPWVILSQSKYNENEFTTVTVE